MTITERMVVRLANRRCISSKITESLQFYNLSKASQALYLHLIANADDDGIAEGKLVLRLGGFKGRDLQGLIESGFVTVIEPSNNIVYVENFQSFNTLKDDRSTPSIYRQHLIDRFPALENVLFKPKRNAFGKQNDSVSQSKLSQGKSNQVNPSQVSSKLKEEPSGDGMDDSDNEQTQTDNCHDLFPFDFSDATIPPSNRMIEAFFRERVYYGIDDSPSLQAPKQANSFIKLNEKNGWHFVQKNGLLATLEQFIRHDATMSRKYDEWQPSEDFLNERKAVELISSPEFEELSEKYYVLANTEYGCSSQEQIAEWLLDNYDGLSPRGRYRLDDDFRKAEEESDDGTDEDNQYQYDEPDTESELFMRFKSAAKDVWTYVQHHDESMTDEKVLEWWHKARNKYNSIETVILNFEQNVKRARGEEFLPFE